MYGHCLGLLDRVAMVESKPAGLQKGNSNVDHRLDDLRKRFESYAYDRTQHNFQLRIQKKDLHWLHEFCCFLKVRFHNGDKFEGKGVVLHPHHDMTSQLIQSGNSRFFAFHGQLAVACSLCWRPVYQQSEAWFRRVFLGGWSHRRGTASSLQTFVTFFCCFMR